MFGRTALRQTGRILAGAIRDTESHLPHNQSRAFIYRNYEDVKNAGMVKIMPSSACESRRYLLRKDGLGFSFHQTVIYKGQKMFINYQNHLEAVFITHGTGWIEIVDKKDGLGNGKRYKLEPGVMYGLDGHEKHWLGCDEHDDMTCICAFTPPCDGAEAQSPEGVFPFIGADGKPDYEYWKKHEEQGKKVTITIEAGYDQYKRL